MSRGKTGLQFDITELIARARRVFAKRLGDITVELPFLSISINPTDLEQRVAREIVIRLSDRRVLNGRECCDDCIDQSLASLQEIRSTLVEKQVELASAADGALYLLIEAMLEGIRQFLTYEQRLNQKTAYRASNRRVPELRQPYFGALEALRSHLNHCLGQVTAIAKIRAPKNAPWLAYGGTWPLGAYLHNRSDKS